MAIGFAISALVGGCLPAPPKQTDYITQSAEYSTAVDVQFTEAGPSDVLPKAMIYQTQCASICMETSVAGTLPTHMKSIHFLNDSADAAVKIHELKKVENIQGVGDYAEVMSQLKSDYTQQKGSPPWSKADATKLETYLTQNPGVTILSFMLVNSETQARWRYFGFYVPGPDKGVDKVHVVIHIQNPGTKSPNLPDEKKPTTGTGTTSPQPTPVTP